MRGGSASVRCGLVLQQRRGTQHKRTTGRLERGAGGEREPHSPLPSEVHKESMSRLTMTHYVTSSVVEANDTTNTYSFDSSGFGQAAVAPNWCRWIESYQVDSGGAVNLDVDGEYPPNARPVAVLDLSAAMSHQMGRQMGQNQTYRIRYVSVTLENKDDTIDNSESIVFSGRLRWYSPTHHRVEAYQRYRSAWKHYYKGSTNTLAFDNEFSATQGEYLGLRVGLCETPAVMQVPFHSTDPFTDVDGTYPALNTIFNAYDDMLPSGGAVGKKPDNALWTSGRTGYPEGIDWMTYLKNLGPGQMGAQGECFQWTGNADVMCGLLCLDIQGSGAQGDLSDSVFTDEYRIRITIGVDGWGGDF